MKAVLWDMDDTLLDSLPARMKALAHAHEVCLGCRTDPVALWRSHRGGTLEQMGQRLLGTDWERFTTAYRDYYYQVNHGIQPYDGVGLILETLAHTGTPMAVVTSKVSWGATEELSRAGILAYFQAVVGFDDTENHKPDPEPIYTALDRLLIEPSRDVFFVGDSPADIWAARNAGCRSVAALWGTLDEELVRDAMPDAIAERPRDLTALLGNGRRHEARP